MRLTGDNEAELCGKLYRLNRKLHQTGSAALVLRDSDWLKRLLMLKTMNYRVGELSLGSLLAALRFICFKTLLMM